MQGAYELPEGVYQPPGLTQVQSKPAPTSEQEERALHREAPPNHLKSLHFFGKNVFVLQFFLENPPSKDDGENGS